MPAILEAESTLTDRYQTTVPEAVRRALRLERRDRIHFEVRPNGEVVLSRIETADETDPALGPFLNLLTRDISEHPEHLRTIDTELVERARSLTAAISVDLDAALDTDDE